MMIVKNKYVYRGDLYRDGYGMPGWISMMKWRHEMAQIRGQSEAGGRARVSGRGEAVTRKLNLTSVGVRQRWTLRNSEGLETGAMNLEEIIQLLVVDPGVLRVVIAVPAAADKANDPAVSNPTQSHNSIGICQISSADGVRSCR